VSEAIPEKTLLAAILLRAIRDFVCYADPRNAEEEQMSQTARQWLFEDTDESEYLVSFSKICLVMELDQVQVRRRIRQMTPRDAERMSRFLRI
jgi:hypothetical protein